MMREQVLDVKAAPSVCQNEMISLQRLLRQALHPAQIIFKPSESELDSAVLT